MTEPAALHATTTQFPASANGSVPSPRPASAAPRRRLKTRVSGMRTALTAGALITQLRMIMRRDRHRQPPAPATPSR